MTKFSSKKKHAQGKNPEPGILGKCPFPPPPPLYFPLTSEYPSKKNSPFSLKPLYILGISTPFPSFPSAETPPRKETHHLPPYTTPQVSHEAPGPRRYPREMLSNRKGLLGPVISLGGGGEGKPDEVEETMTLEKKKKEKTRCLKKKKSGGVSPKLAKTGGPGFPLQQNPTTPPPRFAIWLGNRRVNQFIFPPMPLLVPPTHTPPPQNEKSNPKKTFLPPPPNTHTSICQK